MRAGIEPGGAAAHDFDVELSLFQVARFKSVISSSPRAEGLSARANSTTCSS